MSRSFRPGRMAAIGIVKTEPRKPVETQKDAAAVQKALEAQVGAARSRTPEQLKVISDIAWRKYRYLQVALWAFGIGVALCVLAVLPS